MLSGLQVIEADLGEETEFLAETRFLPMNKRLLLSGDAGVDIFLHALDRLIQRQLADEDLG